MDERRPPLGVVLTAGAGPLPGPTMAAAQAALADLVVIRLDAVDPDELVSTVRSRTLVVLVDVRCEGLTAELIVAALADPQPHPVVHVQPVLETLKLVRDDRIVRTVDREQVRVVSTPIVLSGATLAEVPCLADALLDPTMLIGELRRLGPVELREAPPHVRRSAGGTRSLG